MRLSLQCTITVNDNSNKSKEQILPMVIHGLHCKFHRNLHSPSRAVTWYNKTYKILHLWIVTLVHHFYSDDLSPLVLSTRGYCNQCHGVCIAIRDAAEAHKALKSKTQIQQHKTEIKKFTQDKKELTIEQLSEMVTDNMEFQGMDAEFSLPDPQEPHVW